MGKGRDIVVLILLLAVVLVSFLVLLTYSQNVNNASEKSEFKSSASYTIVSGEREITSNRIIASDRYVGDLNTDGQIIVIGSSGSAYIIENGVVLVDGMVISASEDSYSIYRINDARKSISSN